MLLPDIFHLSEAGYTLVMNLCMFVTSHRGRKNVTTTVTCTYSSDVVVFFVWFFNDLQHKHAYMHLGSTYIYSSMLNTKNINHIINMHDNAKR